MRQRAPIDYGATRVHHGPLESTLTARPQALVKKPRKRKGKEEEDEKKGELLPAPTPIITTTAIESPPVKRQRKQPVDVIVIDDDEEAEPEVEAEAEAKPEAEDEVEADDDETMVAVVAPQQMTIDKKIEVKKATTGEETDVDQEIEMEAFIVRELEAMAMAAAADCYQQQENNDLSAAIASHQEEEDKKKHNAAAVQSLLTIFSAPGGISPALAIGIINALERVGYNRWAALYALVQQEQGITEADLACLEDMGIEGLVFFVLGAIKSHLMLCNIPPTTESLVLASTPLVTQAEALIGRFTSWRITLPRGEQQQQQLIVDLTSCSKCGTKNKGAVIVVADNKFGKCNACHTVAYCGRPCQIADWDKHKPECARRKTEAASSTLGEFQAPVVQLAHHAGYIPFAAPVTHLLRVLREVPVDPVLVTQPLVIDRLEQPGLLAALEHSYVVQALVEHSPTQGWRARGFYKKDGGTTPTALALVDAHLGRSKLDAVTIGALVHKYNKIFAGDDDNNNNNRAALTQQQADAARVCLAQDTIRSDIVSGADISDAISFRKQASEALVSKIARKCFAATATSTTTTKQNDDDKKIWQCKTCTFARNPISATQCGMCNAAKTAKPIRFWTCAVCTYERNLPEHLCCGTCGKQPSRGKFDTLNAMLSEYARDNDTSSISDAKITHLAKLLDATELQVASWFARKSMMTTK